MSIAARTPREQTRRPRRRADGTTPVLSLVAPEPESGIGDTRRLLRDVLADAESAAGAALRELHRRESERRRAAAALEADLAPVRIDEAERARRRDLYAAAEQALAASAIELARTRAVVGAARLLTDTLIDKDAPAGAIRTVPVITGPAS